MCLPVWACMRTFSDPGERNMHKKFKWLWVGDVFISVMQPPEVPDASTDYFSEKSERKYSFVCG